MNPLTKIVSLSIASSIMIFVVHIAVSRLWRKLAPQLAAVFAILLAQLPLFFLLWRGILKNSNSQKIELFCAILYCIILFASSGYIYFHLFNTTETARRIRILHEIKTSGSLSEEEMLPLYKRENIIELRLKRLVDTNQLKLDGNCYHLNQRLLYWSAIIVSIWRTVLGLNELDT